MKQKVYKYIAYCDLDYEDYLGNNEIVIKGDTIDELMDKIETYYFHHQAWFGLDDEPEMEAQHLDDTMCIGDLQFITYSSSVLYRR